MVTFVHELDAPPAPLPPIGETKRLTAELTARVGAEIDRDGTREAVDYRTTLALLNEALDLGLEDQERDILALFFDGGIRNAHRFGQNAEILSWHRENSGAHSCLAALQANFMLEGPTGTLSQFRADAEQHGHKRLKYNMYKQAACLAALVHDGGEALGEPLSLNGAAMQGVEKDTPMLEREVLRYGLLLAAYCYEQHPGNYEEARADYAARMGELRGLFELEKNGGSLLPVEEVFRKTLPPEIRDTLKHRQPFYDNMLPLSELETTVSEGSHQFIRQLRALHFIVEGQRDTLKKLGEPAVEQVVDALDAHMNLNFLMNFVKAAEHVQGGKQLQHFALRKDGVASLAGLAPRFEWGDEKWREKWPKSDISNLIQKQFSYTEGETNKLFVAAGKDADLVNIARSAVSITYQLCARMARHYGAWMGLPIPEDMPIVNRPDHPPTFATLPGFTSGQLSHAGAVQRSRGILASVYEMAATKVMTGDFTPETDPGKMVPVMENGHEGAGKAKENKPRFPTLMESVSMGTLPEELTPRFLPAMFGAGIGR